jgi:hypothetical protein
MKLCLIKGLYLRRIFEVKLAYLQAEKGYKLIEEYFAIKIIFD